jgi:hypothetical protein
MRQASPESKACFIRHNCWTFLVDHAVYAPHPISISAPRAAKLRVRARSPKIDSTQNIAVSAKLRRLLGGHYRAHNRMLHVLPLIGVLLGGDKLCQGMSPGH